jgi:hypothetical protein
MRSSSWWLENGVYQMHSSPPLVTISLLLPEKEQRSKKKLFA